MHKVTVTFEMSGSVLVYFKEKKVAVEYLRRMDSKYPSCVVKLESVGFWAWMKRALAIRR